MMEPSIFRASFQPVCSRFGIPTKGSRWEQLRDGYYNYLKDKVTDRGIVVACEEAFANADRLPKPKALLAMVPNAERVWRGGAPERRSPQAWPTDDAEAWERGMRHLLRRWKAKGAMDICGDPPECLTRRPTGPVDYWYLHLRLMHWLTPIRPEFEAEAKALEAALIGQGWEPGNIDASRRIPIPFVGPLGIQLANQARDLVPQGGLVKVDAELARARAKARGQLRQNHGMGT